MDPNRISAYQLISNQEVTLKSRSTLTLENCLWLLFLQLSVASNFQTVLS